MPELSARTLRGILTPEAAGQARRLTDELTDLLRTSDEPVLYFGDEPGGSWITLWREPGGDDYELALAIPFDDPEPVESHISRVLIVGIGEDLVDPEDDQVLVDWESTDVIDGSDAEVAALLSLAVITAYQPVVDLAASHWTGPQHTPEGLQELRARLVELGVFSDD